jgi:hypothetical protein
LLVSAWLICGATFKKLASLERSRLALLLLKQQAVIFRRRCAIPTLIGIEFLVLNFFRWLQYRQILFSLVVESVACLFTHIGSSAEQVSTLM